MVMFCMHLIYASWVPWPRVARLIRRPSLVRSIAVLHGAANLQDVMLSIALTIRYRPSTYGRPGRAEVVRFWQ